MKLCALLLAAALIAGAATTVTLKGKTYTLKDHPRVWFDGPGGALTASLAAKAYTGNVPWDAIVASVTGWVASASGNQIGTNTAGSFPSYQLTVNRGNLESGHAAMDAALVCYAGSGTLQSQACTMASWLLTHVEQYAPIGACNETVSYCGVSQEFADVGSKAMESWSNAYTLMRAQLTTSEQQHYADKILNDRSEWGGVGGLDGATKGAACVNTTVNTTVVLSLTAYKTIVASEPIFGTTVNVGDWVWTSTSTNNGVFVKIVSFSDSTHATTDADSLSQHANGLLSALGGNADATGNISISGTTATRIDGTAWTTNVFSGDYFVIGGVGYKVTANTTTTATLATAPGDTASVAYISGGIMSYKPGTWTPNACGALWTIKHHLFSNWIIGGPNTATSTTGWVSLYPDATSYPTTPQRGAESSTPAGEFAHNLVYTKAWGYLLPFLALVDDDTNAAARSKFQLTKLYDFWQDYIWAYAKAHWNGETQSGSYYQMARGFQMIPGVAVAVTNSLTTAPPVDLTGGNWFKPSLATYYMGYNPATPNEVMRWGQDSVASCLLDPSALMGAYVATYLYPTSTETRYFNYWLRNLWGNHNNSNNKGWTAGTLAYAQCYGCAAAFVFSDPAQSAVALDSSAPSQYFFGPGDTGAGINVLYSRTGFPGYSSSSTDKGATLAAFFAHWIGNIDHIGTGNPGSYKIVKRGYLLAEDKGTGVSPAGNGAYTNYEQLSNYIEIGGANNLIAPTVDAPQAPIISRAHVSDSQSRFAYAMADLTGAYKATAALSRANRHFAHLKGGTQDFIVVYDDVASISGKRKKAYLHYPNNGQTGEGSTSLAVDTVTSTFSTSSELLTKILAPAGASSIYIHDDGAYSGGNGQTDRISICASSTGSACDDTNTSTEFAVVHMPVDGVAGSLPPIAMMGTVDSNFRGIEIDGSAPKVALFARNGATYSSATFTAAHSGTAQILVAGLDAGTYNVNGPVSLSGLVSDASRAVYFEGPAGDYVISQVGAPPPLAVGDTAIPSATAGTAISPVTLSATGGVAPYTWAATANTCTGLSISSDGVVSGTPTTAGICSITATVTDSAAATASRAFSFTVAAAASPLAITTTSPLPAGQAGVAYSQSLSASGGTPPLSWTATGSTCAWATVSSAGVITGTPISGTCSITAQVADSVGGTASTALSITTPLIITPNVIGIYGVGIKLN